jgi:hypothetical protein
LTEDVLIDFYFRLADEKIIKTNGLFFGIKRRKGVNHRSTCRYANSINPYHSSPVAPEELDMCFRGFVEILENKGYKTNSQKCLKIVNMVTDVEGYEYDLRCREKTGWEMVSKEYGYNKLLRNILNKKKKEYQCEPVYDLVLAPLIEEITREIKKEKIRCLTIGKNEVLNIW